MKNVRQTLSKNHTGLKMEADALVTTQYTPMVGGVLQGQNHRHIVPMTKTVPLQSLPDQGMFLSTLMVTARVPKQTVLSSPQE